MLKKKSTTAFCFFRERYRDLIQAADTIEEMKLTTSSTLDHINEMTVACKSLHDTHLVGFKVQEQPKKPR